MKRLLILFSIIGLALTSCEDKRLQTYMANVPVYMSYEALRSSFDVVSGVSMEKPGKISFYGSHMFINEYQKGIHVVDLSDPTQPELKAFIEVPGNVDMAIRNDQLFAESFVDLLVIDITNPEQPELTERIEDLFEYVIPPYDYDYPLDEIDEKKGVITGYDVKKITREVYNNPYPWPIYWDYRLESSFADGGMTGANSNTYGVGGSMARFITYDDYLYALESSWKLKSINIANIDNLKVENELSLWGNVETLFIADAHLYVGTSNGMHILDLANPGAPNFLSTYQHITACDPVVVEGDRAYVTLRTGNWCGGTQNLLEVIDISDKYEPIRLSSFSMKKPYGLGIDNGTLFVCEGEYGLKVYDATYENSITSHLIAAFPGINAYDVIPMESFLFMIGEDGFYIYDYSDLNNISILGSLLISPSE
ncbi:MAG: hypothetical protein DRJ29_01150 [Bacteroidetes bacterium]|nr:MAG: hypothetical protein DRJ29_01150 [Bacteroidota bacterium]